MRKTKNLENSYEIQLTNKCNWNCDYCLVDVHNMKDIPFSTVINYVKSLPDNAEVTLSGGEPGTLHEDEIKELFEVLQSKNCSIDLLTNGLFLKKYPEYFEKVDYTLYHCVEYLTDDIQFPNLDQSKVAYVLVIKNDDWDNLSKFMDKYKHIKFMLSPNKLLSSNNMIFNNFIEFYTNNKDKLHPRTFREFIKNISRI